MMSSCRWPPIGAVVEDGGLSSFWLIGRLVIGAAEGLGGAVAGLTGAGVRLGGVVSASIVRCEVRLSACHSVPPVGSSSRSESGSPNRLMRVSRPFFRLSIGDGCGLVRPGSGGGSARSAASFLALVAEERCIRTPITGAALFPAAGVVIGWRGRVLPAFSTRPRAGARIVGACAFGRPMNGIRGSLAAG